MIATPLSDVMAEHADAGSPESYGRFLRLFADSVVGIVGVSTTPDDGPGLLSVGELGAGRTSYGDGQLRILTFADPEIASRTPGSQCNAGISGQVLLQMAVVDPGCVGILVNCATRPISLIITKEAAQELLEGTTTAEPS
ncbi:hypothetical protein [Actinoplanes sp. NPDC020271]|uniref:hypothetical protein n=1 Tax=Actinoplanes sp. NPDC020271 TaxID=3363896 RepID=UPI0037B1938A